MLKIEGLEKFIKTSVRHVCNFKLQIAAYIYQDGLISVEAMIGVENKSDVSALVVSVIPRRAAVKGVAYLLNHNSPCNMGKPRIGHKKNRGGGTPQFLAE